MKHLRPDQQSIVEKSGYPWPKVIISVFLYILCTAPATQARSLFWKDVAVEARLDSVGLLHVIETQTYVFTGDWNGGERVFNIRSGQGLGFEGIDRVDGNQTIPLTHGNLDVVGHYNFIDGTTIRWRNRLPGDPEFNNTERTYRIRYTLSGVLSGRNNQYQLAHDFCFPDRSGIIEHFTLHFELDPVWSGLQSPVGRQENALPAGQGVIVRGQLRYSGSDQPAGAVVVPPVWLGPALLAILLAGLAALVRLFLQRERRAGRFDPLLPLTDIDGKWLAETIFSLPPEVVGAAWDDRIGAAEVGAILATLVQEKKIVTSVEPRFLRRPKLTMQLLVDRTKLTGYSGTMVRKLFFNNRVNTDSDAINKYYKKKGLDLIASIRRPVEEKLAHLADWKTKTILITWKLDGLPLVITFALLVTSGIWGSGNDSAFCTSEGFIGILTLVVGGLVAHFHARSLDNLSLRFASVGVFLLPLLGGTGYHLLSVQGYLYHFPTMIVAILWNWAVCNLVLGVLRINQTRDKIDVRKKLLAARTWFKAQLRTPTPQLHDDWYPYLIAFGLGANIDSWFRSFGNVAGKEQNRPWTSGAEHSSFNNSERANWSGGGGGFGGAGASGSWVAAATAIGYGVSGTRSSDSSGGSGGSGGSSSSGGGGGGGW